MPHDFAAGERRQFIDQTQVTPTLREQFALAQEEEHRSMDGFVLAICIGIASVGLIVGWLA